MENLKGQKWDRSSNKSPGSPVCIRYFPDCKLGRLFIIYEVLFYGFDSPAVGHLRFPPPAALYLRLVMMNSLMVQHLRLALL
jgi:hypothetical protein